MLPCGLQGGSGRAHLRTRCAPVVQLQRMMELPLRHSRPEQLCLRILFCYLNTKTRNMVLLHLTSTKKHFHIKRSSTITSLMVFSRVCTALAQGNCGGKQQRENTSGRIFPRLTMPSMVHFHYPYKAEHFHVLNLTSIIK